MAPHPLLEVECTPRPGHRRRTQSLLRGCGRAAPQTASVMSCVPHATDRTRTLATGSALTNASRNTLAVLLVGERRSRSTGGAQGWFGKSWRLTRASLAGSPGSPLGLPSGQPWQLVATSSICLGHGALSTSPLGP